MTNKEIVKGFFIESYRNHNYDFALTYMSENYYDHSPANARSNKEAVGILKLVEKMYANLEVTILDLIEENDMVATRIKFTGIHSGEVMGIAPTGAKISFEALENFRLQDGKIVESWGYWPDLYIKNFLEERK